jgi:AcrR family transcriptional regulator
MIEAISGESQAGDQRRRIIAAMVAGCAEKTYAATTIGDVVAGAHISRTTFYREFEDKRACFDAAIEYSIEEAWAVAATAPEPEDTAAQAVRRSTAAVLDLFAARPELAHLMVGEAVAVEPAVIERYRDLIVPAIRRLWSEEDDGATHLDPWLAFGRAQLLIFDRVTAEEAERLPDLLPELVYLTVAPFAGHDAALEEARACSGLLAGGVAP